MRFTVSLDRMADLRQYLKKIGGPAQLVHVTEVYARRMLKLPKDKPLVYRGMRLKCIGSRIWRERQAKLKKYREWKRERGYT